MNESKDLLFKYLCMALPYGVIVNVNGNNEKVDEINPFEGIITCGFQSFDINECKPYLRPMSSMTEEELVHFLGIRGMNINHEELKTFRTGKTAIVSTLPSYSRHINWLLEHHFEFMELIPKGLAIEAPEGMYN